MLLKNEARGDDMADIMAHLRNVINRRNVVKKPIDNFNACDDFFMTVVISHILVVAIKYLKLKSLSEIPSDDVIPDTENLWMQPKEVRKDVIESTSQKIVEKYVSFKFCDPESSEESECASDNEVEGSMAGSRTSIEDDDPVKGYGRQLLSVGLFYWEYSDSIKEGDGERLLRCWRTCCPCSLILEERIILLRHFDFYTSIPMCCLHGKLFNFCTRDLLMFMVSLATTLLLTSTWNT